MLGDQWKVTLHGDADAYNASEFTAAAEFRPATASVDAARALPQVAVDFRWPFARDGGAWGTQLIEPIAQLIVAPQSGDSQMRRYPNEDSLDFEFTDANLFGFNRFTGTDRLEGGVRANVGSARRLVSRRRDVRRAGWPILPHQQGQPVPRWPPGLHDQVSDIVARGTFAPAQWLDVTYRTRLSTSSSWPRVTPKRWRRSGWRSFRLSGGYIYTTFNPYTYYDQPPPPPPGNPYYFPRNEVTIGAVVEVGRLPFQRLCPARPGDQPDGRGRRRRDL